MPAAANAIVGLDDEWVELSEVDWTTTCRDDCQLQQLALTDGIRVFRRLRETGNMRFVVLCCMVAGVTAGNAAAPDLDALVADMLSRKKN